MVLNNLKVLVERKGRGIASLKLWLLWLMSEGRRKEEGGREGRGEGDREGRGKGKGGGKGREGKGRGKGKGKGREEKTGGSYIGFSTTNGPFSVNCIY